MRWLKMNQPFFTLILLASLLLVPLFLIKAGVWEIGSSPVNVNAEPEFSIPGGYYENDVWLKLFSPDSEAEILFTLDGSIPSEQNGSIFDKPIYFPSGETAVYVIRARTRSPQTGLGPVTTATYFFNFRTDLPLLSLALDPDDLWDEESGIYANPLEKGIDWERAAFVSFVDKDRISGFQSNVGVRIHGGFTRTYEKKSFRLYFRDEYGMAWLNYPLFNGSELSRFKRLVLHSGSQDSPQPLVNWSLMRNQLVAELARQTGGNVVDSQPVLLFLNGEFWGVYQLRERIDERFLATKYGIERSELLDTPDIGENRIISDSSREHWDKLLTFLETNSLADPENFSYVTTQVDLDNFVDYTLIQIYSANIDWPHRNFNLFRPQTPLGRWQWIFWDSDSSFGARPYSFIESNMLAQALNPSHPDTNGRDTLLLRKLLENDGFRERFISRTADLLNTVLAPDSVLGAVDRLAAEMESAMFYESTRWNSTVAWSASVEQIRDFGRRRPGIVRQHMIEQFGLGAPVSLSIQPPPEGGQIIINGFVVPGGVWEGVYFAGSEVRVTAVPDPGFVFSGWQDFEGGADMQIILNESHTLIPQFTTVPDSQLKPGDVRIIEVGVNNSGDITGDWVKLRVERPTGIDLRGWRLTDNDSMTATDEGSLIFGDSSALAQLSYGVEILVVATISANNDLLFPIDDLDSRDRRLVLYAGNENIKISDDSWFNLGVNDNIALLAPGSNQNQSGEQSISLIFLGKVEETELISAYGIFPDRLR